MRWFGRRRTGIRGVLHAVHLPLVLAIALIPLAVAARGFLRWLLVALLVYLALFFLIAWPQILKPFRNAAEAERRNRALMP